MPEFTFTIQGTTLTMDEMFKVHKFYEVYATAEYLLENHPQLSQEYAIYLATAVRDLMDCDGYDEDEAIDEIFKKNNIKE